eukprot:s1726_g5.t1
MIFHPRLWCNSELLGLEENAFTDYVERWMKLSLRPLWPREAPLSLLPVEPPWPSAEAVQKSLVTLDEMELPRGLVPDQDLYPAPGYLRDCALAHAAVGLLDHFLDTTLLADRRTTLRSYLAANPGLSAYVGVEQATTDARSSEPAFQMARRP